MGTYYEMKTVYADEKLKATVYEDGEIIGIFGDYTDAKEFLSLKMGVKSLPFAEKPRGLGEIGKIALTAAICATICGLMAHFFGVGVMVW